MGSFADLQVALEYKRAMQQIVREVLDTDRPLARYGRVTDIDSINQKAQVVYTGEIQAVTVNFGLIEPYAIGQYVRVEGAVGDKHITDIQDGHSVHTGSVRFSDYFRNVDDIRQITARMWSADHYADGFARLIFQNSTATLNVFEMRENDGLVFIPDAQLGDTNDGAGYFRKPRGQDPYVGKRLQNSAALVKNRSQIAVGGPYANVTSTFGVTMSGVAADVAVTCNADAGAQGVASSAAFVTTTGFKEYLGTYTGTSLWTDYHVWAQ